ncbi:MAG: chemotaxis protein CheW [Anaerolineales bacterium]
MERPESRGDGASATEHKLLLFRLAERALALSVKSVAQIIPMVTITPLPQAHPAVEGVINVRSKAIPVINLRCQQGLPDLPPGPYTPIILVEIGPRTVGLIVDEVLDVVTVSASDVLDLHEILPDELGELPLLKGLVHAEGEPVLILAPHHLLHPRQVQALEEALDALPTPLAGEVQDLAVAG